MGIGYRIDQLLKSNEGNLAEQDKVYAFGIVVSNDKNIVWRGIQNLCLVPHSAQMPIGFST